jgi:hypothetical protein
MTSFYATIAPSSETWFMVVTTMLRKEFRYLGLGLIAGLNAIWSRLDTASGSDPNCQ